MSDDTTTPQDVTTEDVVTTDDTTTEQAPIARATMDDVSAIIANPAKYGVSFPTKPIHSGTGNNKVVLRNDCPRVEIDNLTTFLAYFGSAVALDGLNGTSTYIKGENMARALIVKDRKVTNDAIRVELVKRVLLATPAPRGGFAPKYVAVDGTTFSTLLDSQKHSLTVMIAGGVQPEIAKKLLGIG